MYPPDDSTDARIQQLQERIEHLEQANRWHVQALDMLASMGDMHGDASSNRAPQHIYSLARQHMARLIDFDVTAFLTLSDEDSSFELSDCQPGARFAEIQNEIDSLIEQGEFAWALNRNHPVILKSGATNQPVLLHVLASRIRVRGMFIAIMADGHKTPSAVVLNLLSVILHNCAQALESAALYKLINERNKSLKQTVQQRTRELAYQNEHDSLTGLPNRLLFHDRMKRALTNAVRHNMMVAVLILDMDMFKRINDTLGHESGDQLLKEQGQRLVHALDSADFNEHHTSITVSHLGGDEFGVLLANLNTADSIPLLAQCVTETLSKALYINGHDILVTCSIGISLYPNDGATPEVLLKNANAAMHHAKQEGGNRYLFYAEEMNAASLDRLLLENRLRHAIKNHELALHYQPKVDIATGRITGWEALLRWHHPEMGVVPPDVFIPLAENTGLITSISEWVLITACRQAKAWLEAGFADLCISVNLSAKQFLQKDMLKLIFSILDQVELPPHHLELEITESTLMQDIEATSAMLDELQEIGVGLSIDDFGTGYSSLSYLKRFSIDCLKIDRSFVHDVTTNSDDAAIVTAIIAMARSMGLKVVAEGVETAEQLAFLAALECEEMQGYLFSPAVPADQATQLLQSGKRLQA